MIITCEYQLGVICKAWLPGSARIPNWSDADSILVPKIEYMYVAKIEDTIHQNFKLNSNLVLSQWIKRLIIDWNIKFHHCSVY